ncbi:PASTA domain-containing protein [Archangium lansingense]|uniref:PASTA domain-containing protein n=1 Tax=Archangium lansingense TaxID=2995310 RepID=A0ABT3ZYY1_9BACT|nr:PASTA domain-containing protein [Archangium lansinium]MCY1074286.1 PASTA domain-containing protein [Archangium lansinium]
MERRIRGRSAGRRPWAILLVCLSFAMSGIASRSAMARPEDLPALSGMKLDEATEALNTWRQNQEGEWQVNITHKPEVPDGANRDLILVHEGEGSGDESFEIPSRTTRTVSILYVTLVLETKVPDLKGQTWQEATRMLREHGLTPKAESTPGGDDWLVTTQSLGPGALVRLNEEVSLGFKPPPPPPPPPRPTPSPPPRLVRVPTVLGMPVAEARQTARKARLQFESRPSGQGRGAGRVLWQKPLPGTLVRPGTRVAVVASPAILTPWLVTGSLVVVLWLLLTVIRAVRANRARREREWVHQHVQIKSQVTLGEPRIESREEQGHSVTVVLQKDRGSQVFEKGTPP